jgi:cytochrome c556
MKNRHQKTTTWLGVSVLAGALFAACESKPPEPTGTESSAAPKASSTAAPTTESGREKMSKTTEALMEDHFTQALTIRKAVIDGKLDDVAKPAQWFADFEGLETLDAKWKPHMEAMIEAAKSAKGAGDDVEKAAAAVGQMGQACGACHASVGGPAIEFDPLPEPESGTKPHMDKHKWALDRLWEGLMGPDDEAWRKGAEALTDAPLTAEALVPASGAEDVEALAKKVHEIGAKAPAADKPAARADIYGQLLATCGACHKPYKVEVK